MPTASSIARRVASGGTGGVIAVKLLKKLLNVLAILMGEGFSMFYQDADDRV